MIDQVVLDAIKEDNVELLHSRVKNLEKGYLSSPLWDINYKTPLMLAARNGSSYCLAYLLQNGAAVYIDKTDLGGRTALMYAAYEGYWVCANLLIDFNANTLIKTNLGHTASDLAAVRVNSSEADVLKRNYLKQKTKQAIKEERERQRIEDCKSQIMYSDDDTVDMDEDVSDCSEEEIRAAIAEMDFLGQNCGEEQVTMDLLEEIDGCPFSAEQFAQIDWGSFDWNKSDG